MRVSNSIAYKNSSYRLGGNICISVAKLGRLQLITLLDFWAILFEIEILENSRDAYREVIHIMLLRD